MTADWSTEQRRVFGALADEIVPGSGGSPSMREADPHSRLLDRALRARPDLAERLARLLDQSAGRQPAEVVSAVGATDPPLLEDLIALVVGTYYMSPKVLRRLGYPGQRATPPLPDEAEFYLSDGLLEPVLKRGARYRPTPSERPEPDPSRRRGRPPG